MPHEPHSTSGGWFIVFCVTGMGIALLAFGWLAGGRRGQQERPNFLTQPIRLP